MEKFLSPIQNNIVGIGIFFAAIVAITLTSIFYSTVLFIIQKINSFFANFFSSPKGKEIYTETVIYYKKWLILISLLIITDITLLVIPKENILK